MYSCSYAILGSSFEWRLIFSVSMMQSSWLLHWPKHQGSIQGRNTAESEFLAHPVQVWHKTLFSPHHHSAVKTEAVKVVKTCVKTEFRVCAEVAWKQKKQQKYWLSFHAVFTLVFTQFFIQVFTLVFTQFSHRFSCRFSLLVASLAARVPKPTHVSPGT